MKKLVLIAGILLISLMTFAQQSGNESYDEITSIQRIMVQAAGIVKEAENNGDLEFEIVHLQFDLILSSNWKYTYRVLSSNWTYVIYAEGETGMIEDFDVRILAEDAYGEWEEVASDVKSDFGAMVAVSPSVPTNYAIGVKAASFSPGFAGGHYYLMIAHKKPE